MTSENHEAEENDFEVVEVPEKEDENKKPKAKPKGRGRFSRNQNESDGPIRVKLPRNKEVIGIIEQRLGGNKMSIACLDGKTRNCRVPGRLRRRLWLRPNDVVIVEPWELDDTRGDILFKYRPNQIDWLKKNGHLKTAENDF